MATVQMTVCDDCKKSMAADEPRYSWLLRKTNVRLNPGRLPFTDLCVECNDKRLDMLGGSRDEWSQDELAAMTRTELRDLAALWDLTARDKAGYIEVLIGKPIAGPVKPEQVEEAQKKKAKK